jgi:transcriptional regulator with XRE-family HTH domain
MIGSKLRTERERAGLSLRDLAERTGGVVSYAALSMIENDQREPRLDTLHALAKALRLTIAVSPRGVVVKGGRR